VKPQWDMQTAKEHLTRRRADVAYSFRRLFTRENLIADLKTLLIVAPLTVLIWVYAEEQQLVTEPNVALSFAVQSADPAQRQVSLVSPADGTLHVTLQGSQVGIDHIKAILRQTFMSQPVEIQVSADMSAGFKQLVPLDQIAGNPMFYSQGVTVVSCSPETITVRVDALEDRSAQVVAPADLTGLVKATFNPPAVTLRGPSEVLQTLSEQGPLTAVADLAGDPVLKQPGNHDKVPLHLLPQANITILPNIVTADLSVGQSDESLAVTPVPVKVQAPKWLMDNYKFSYKEWLTDAVTLVGPRRQIEQINPSNAKVTAVVDLDNTDADFHGLKPISFQDRGLPDGVTVQPDSSPRMIQIGVDPR
jgi:hypothetical protein